MTLPNKIILAVLVLFIIGAPFECAFANEDTRDEILELMELLRLEQQLKRTDQGKEKQGKMCGHTGCDENGVNAAPMTNSHASRIEEIERSNSDAYYDILNYSQDLAVLVGQVYYNFKVQMFQDSDLVIDGSAFNPAIFPTFLTSSVRSNLDAGDLIFTDVEYIRSSLTAMRNVKQDEVTYHRGSDNFVEKFGEIVGKLEVLCGKVIQWIQDNEISGENQLTIEAYPWPVQQEFDRYLRTAYILQEIDNFLPIFRLEFSTRFFSY